MGWVRGRIGLQIALLEPTECLIPMKDTKLARSIWGYWVDLQDTGSLLRPPGPPDLLSSQPLRPAPPPSLFLLLFHAQVLT